MIDCGIDIVFQIGSTWSELNIDLDGLTLSGKNKTRATQPTMNQMASTISKIF